MGGSKLPTTKFESWDVTLEYQPAPLNEVSLFNGVSKFLHPQVRLTRDQQHYCLGYLNHWFPYLKQFSRLATEEEVQQNLFEHKRKAAGYPWSARGCSLKGEAIEKFSLDEVRQYYREFTSVISCTLKDELRLKGKDSRLFRPQDLAAYVEGCELFFIMNLYLTKTHFSPIFNRYVLPGPDLTMVFEAIENFAPGNCFGADGSQWDAHFPLAIAEIIATFRAQFTAKDRVHKYYSQMYNGYTNVGGNIVNIIGNPSGHYNTSTDNSLAHMVLIALCGYELKIPFVELDRYIKYYCCGDDLLYSTTHPAFEPESLFELYKKFGVYLEFEDYAPRHADKLTFVGMVPCWRTLCGQRKLLYHMRLDKARASSRAQVKGRTPIDILAKLCSIAQLIFADKDAFEIYSRLHADVLAQFVANKQLSGLEPDVLGQLRSLQPGVLTTAYTEWESSGRRF